MSQKNKEMIKAQLEEAGEQESKISTFLNDYASWDNEFCAQHDGTIGSFQKLSIKIKDISECKEIISRDSINLARAAKIVGTSIAVGGATLLTAGAATPAIAAALLQDCWVRQAAGQ